MTSLGFSGAFEAPIKDEIIKEQIIPMLVERAEKKNQKNYYLKIIEEVKVENECLKVDGSEIIISPQSQLMDVINSKPFKDLTFKNSPVRYSKKSESLKVKKISKDYNMSPIHQAEQPSISNLKFNFELKQKIDQNFDEVKNSHELSQDSKGSFKSLNSSKIA